MRLIGNKTRLLGEITGFLRDRGIRSGTLIDVFSGTASVGRCFKGQGFRVIANDRLSMCYTQAVASVEVGSVPPYRGLKEKHRKAFHSKAFRDSFEFQPEALSAPGSVRLAEAVHFLNRFAEPCDGLIFRNYAPGGGRGRMYFTDENARRIDGALEVLREGFRAGYLERAELHLLLSALLDAADRVANISGTYGAFLKSWQRNALQPVLLRVPEVIESPHANEAHQEDANELIRKVEGDVLYIDPPYNHRQYPANYHVLEVIAEHHKLEDLTAYESALYGKTGLRPYDELRSAYCVAPGDGSRERNAFDVLRDLIHHARVEHVLMSYNEEGVLTREELGGILARFSGKRKFDYDTGMRAVLYKRFCSDADRTERGAKGIRSYSVLEGKKRGEISEWLLYASRATGRARSGRKARKPKPVPAT